MSFWKRLFSADYRAAVSAEAGGQLEQAAEHYVLAGEPAEAARVHLARAERAEERSAELAALRDALHWAGAHETLRTRIQRTLGRALLARARDEGIATSRDRQRVREAASLLTAGGDFASAGEALDAIGDTQGAIRAYRQGGLVERLEAVLARDQARLDRERSLREAFANYELHMRLGTRDQARRALVDCVQIAERKAEYQRLLDELDARLITAGRVVLRRRNLPPLTVVGAPSAALGRDPLCELPLRTGGVSRRHAEIVVAADPPPAFLLRDLGSRNGTLLAGLPIQGTVPLADTGQFGLGDQCEVSYDQRSDPSLLHLRITGGLDAGQEMILAGPDQDIRLDQLANLPIQLCFRNGRPWLAKRAPQTRLTLAGEPVAEGECQLIHGDSFAVDGVEVEVA
ncbi:FHA domain-containing protein [Haliangium sp.]|uniref:FHA domain-containing protein n=1 Tax=Haliangium sp. TaxID=2663208 RepID=UPI003D118FA5